MGEEGPIAGAGQVAGDAHHVDSALVGGHGAQRERSAVVLGCVVEMHGSACLFRGLDPMVPLGRRAFHGCEPAARLRRDPIRSPERTTRGGMRRSPRGDAVATPCATASGSTTLMR